MINLYVLAGFVFLFLLGGTIMFLFTRKAYKNTAHIARQTGNDPSDVIWFQDKFRVVNKEGSWRIEFQRLREHTRSIEGKWWNKFLRSGSGGTKIISVPKDRWEELDLRSHITRGLFLYETNEGEYYPMKIQRVQDEFMFSVLDQDNRQYVISETQAVNDLTRDRKKELALIWAIVVGIGVFGVISLAAMWWISKMHDQNIMQTAQVCGVAANNVIASLNNTQFLGDLTGVLGG